MHRPTTGWIESQVKIVMSGNVAEALLFAGVPTTMGLLILACNKAQFLFGSGRMIIRAMKHGMAFELNRKEIRIRQSQGVRGFPTRGRYHPVRAWPRLFVESCQDLALMHGYSRVLLVRSHRSYSWKHPDSGYALEISEGFGRHLEIRSRLMKRLDGTAQSIPGFEMEKNWWVWSASCAQVEKPRG